MVSAIARWHCCSFQNLIQKHGITPLEMAYADKLQAENDQLRAEVARKKDEVSLYVPTAIFSLVEWL
jgi:hypothetical protein